MLFFILFACSVEADSTSQTPSTDCDGVFANACEAYVTNYFACAEAAGGGLDDTGLMQTCEYVGNNEPIEDVYCCMSDAYASNDCSTAEGLSAANEEAARCIENK